jgi:hypothetical protein
MMSEIGARREMQAGEKALKRDRLLVMTETSQMTTGTLATTIDMTEMTAMIDSEAEIEATEVTVGNPELRIHHTTKQWQLEKTSRATKTEGQVHLTGRNSMTHMPSIALSIRRSKNKSSTQSISTILGSSSDTIQVRSINGNRCRNL